MTVEPQPPVGEVLFGARIAVAQGLVRHLVTSGVERGLIGPREVERIWTRHVLNCAVLGELIAAGERVVDVGSGAGLPGLVLAALRPDLDVVLVEPLERRVTWLREVAGDLGVDVTVHRARAEDVAGTISGRVVTARAVAPLARLLEWGLPLVEPGGQLLAIKGRSAADELGAAAPVLTRWGVGGEVVRCGVEVLAVPTTVVAVRVPDETKVPATAPHRSPRVRRHRRPGNTPA